MFQNFFFVFQNKKTKSAFAAQQLRANYDRSHEKTSSYEHVSNNESKTCAESANSEINVNFHLQNR